MRALAVLLMLAGALALLYAILRGPGEIATFRSALAGGEIRITAGALRVLGLILVAAGLLLSMAARRNAAATPEVHDTASAPPMANTEDVMNGLKFWASKHKMDLPPDDRLGRVIEYLQKGRKIEAIKEWREATNAPLKQSKETVEALERAMRVVARLQ